MQANYTAPDAPDAPLLSKTVMSRLTTGLATVVMAVFGVTGFASAASINTTGPDSTNRVDTNISANCRTLNNNNLRLRASNDQSADSGNAVAADNTEAGSADSGNASNETATSASAHISNGNNNESCACPVTAAGINGTNESIAKTGPDSENTIDTNVNVTDTVTNNNDVNVTNSNEQSASSGDAVVAHNTTGGDARTGDATNSSQASFLVNLVNEGGSRANSQGNGCNDVISSVVTPTAGNFGGGFVGNGGGSGSSAPNAFVGNGGGRGSGSNFSSNHISFANTPRFSPSSNQPTVSNEQPVQSQPVFMSTASSSPRSAPSPIHALSLPVASSSISTTGPGSSNSISTLVNLSSATTNNNNVSVANNNTQSAYSGDATVTDNTSAGSAATGDASNFASADTAVSLTN